MNRLLKSSPAECSAHRLRLAYHLSFALKLNPPTPLLYEFLRSIKRTHDSSAPFGFSLANDAVGTTAAFFLHEVKRLSAERGKHWPLSLFKWIDDNSTRVVLLNHFCAIRTASNG